MVISPFFKAEKSCSGDRFSGIPAGHLAVCSVSLLPPYSVHMPCADCVWGGGGILHFFTNKPVLYFRHKHTDRQATATHGQTAATQYTIRSDVTRVAVGVSGA